MIAAIRKKIFRKSKSLIGERRTRELQHLPFRTLNQLKRPPFSKVGNFCFVEGYGFFINGWIVDPLNQVEKIEVMIGRQAIARIDQGMLRVPREDLMKKYGLPVSHGHPGFTAFVEHSDVSSLKGAKVKLRLGLRGGNEKNISVKSHCASVDALESVKKILNAVPSNSPEKRDLFDHSYGPAISSIWSLRNQVPTSVETLHYNQDLAPAAPKVSLIVPIYGRYDFIEYQLSQFVNDPDMFAHEIIYVIDDPRIHSEVKTVCAAYEKLYKIAFKVLFLERNRGFAGANNTGVEHATAPLLLLINSDVMPSTAGWLTRLVKSAGSDIKSMMLGVRLLYEDDSIQHDGMKFHSSPFVNDLWTNIHPNKGLPKSLVPAKKGLHETEAITGACILLEKANYEKLGGFDENFILGDYEDSDLCMRAREQGISIRMNSHISLYHLERQSQSLVTDARWKGELTYYNCWYHTQKWDESINALQVEVVNA